ncbi:hypothetical protein [Desulfosarcina cetonica]|uniref:hypothetical protein n=1 Tax=Desulfosarcina cetonica TaxID=90730 RepID=UPI0012EEA765|nr:hypothetical protein [Desulfosarcina cetonica]
MVVLLAMLGLHGALAAVRRHIHLKGLRRLAIAATVFVGVMAVMEIRPLRRPFTRCRMMP